MKRRRNASGEPCLCTGRCTCVWNSIAPYTERRTRHVRPVNEWLIKKANRRIAEAAKFYGVTLPYKLRSRRSKNYRTTQNELMGIYAQPAAVDLINTETGAVVAADVDVLYWSGAGTRWNTTRSGRMIERLRTAKHRGKIVRQH